MMDTQVSLRRLRPAAALMAALIFAAVPVLSRGVQSDKANAPADIPPKDAIVKFEGKKYNLLRNDELESFAAELAALTSDKRGKSKNGPKVASTAGGGRDGSKEKLSKKERRGYSEMETIADRVLAGKEDRDQGIKRILEIDWAINGDNNASAIWKNSLDVVAVIGRVRSATLNAVGRGSREHPAANLTAYTGDLSKIDPKPSSFWSRPDSIASKELYAGFGRTSIPDYSTSVYTYDSPHEGYGGHPGFNVKLNGEKFKVKFGEVNTEPFGTRIFWALGFPAIPTDFTPQIKVKYDRQLLSDFSDRKSTPTKLKAAGMTLAKISKRVYSNPFDYIDAVVLKDGSKLTAEEFKSRLFKTNANAKLPKEPESRDELYDKGFESKIDYIQFEAANVRSRDDGPGVNSLGFWDYNFLDHPNRREVRAMAVLNAWLGNYDVRAGNTRLLLVKSKDQEEGRLEHVVSDLGALFGDSRGLYRLKGTALKSGLISEDPNTYPWTISAPVQTGQTSVPIKNFMTITKVEPFYNMNIDDARWMVRLISQLSENQIRQALIGSGCDAAEARLILEKLISRRDTMVRDWGLTNEIALMRPSGVDRKLSYDPRSDRPFEAELPDGKKVAARNTNRLIVSEGVLETAEGKKVKSIASPDRKG